MSYFEINFNRTIEYDEKTKKWVVKKTNGRLIRDRFIQSERLGLLLQPEWHSMTFKPIEDCINNAIIALEVTTDVNETEEKIEFLKGLLKILEEFVEEEKPREKAMEDFIRLMKDQSEQSKEYIDVLIENKFHKNINQDLLNKKYYGKSQCFSGIMTLNDTISFWSEETSLHPKGLGETIVAQIRSVICRFLSMEKNQSAEERAFAVMKKRMTGRPKLDHTVLLHEQQIKQICRYPNIFDVLKYDNEEAQSMVTKFVELEEVYEKFKTEIEKDIIIEGEGEGEDLAFDGKLDSEDESDDDGEEEDDIQQYFNKILTEREACLSDDDELESESESDDDSDDDENDEDNDQ